MAFVFVKAPSKQKPELCEPATTDAATASLELSTFDRVTDRYIPGAFSSSHDAPANTTTRIVHVKAAVCIVCGFHEEAEEDFVHFHCDTLSGGSD